MEMCGCGDLASKVERYRKKRKYMDERVVWSHFIQMCEGLQCLHEQKIVHRDIKAANIFLAADGSVKIGDLNVSKRMKGALLRTQIGTPYYMSPEVWLNKPYSFGADVWAVGCLAYELCALRPPFVGSTFAQLKQAVLVGRYPSLPRNFSRDMTQMIAKLVRVDARSRPSIAQILASEDVKSRKAADWYKGSSVQPKPAQQLAATIMVPQRIANLKKQLPKPCFPDQRPDSPEAWPLGAEAAPAKAAPVAPKPAEAPKPAAAPVPAPKPRVSPRPRASPRAAPAVPQRRYAAPAAQPRAHANVHPHYQPRRYGGNYGQYNRGGYGYRRPAAQPVKSVYGQPRPPLRKPLGSHANARNRAAGVRRYPVSSGYGQYGAYRA